MAFSVSYARIRMVRKKQNGEVLLILSRPGQCRKGP